jgi:hypothetical protein
MLRFSFSNAECHFIAVGDGEFALIKDLLSSRFIASSSSSYMAL